jgi:hypothetical protein
MLSEMGVNVVETEEASKEEGADFRAEARSPSPSASRPAAKP